MPARYVTSVSESLCAVTGLQHPSLRWAAARLTGGLAQDSSIPKTASPVPVNWAGSAAFSGKLPESAKKSLTTKFALMSNFLAVLVCLFTGSFSGCVVPLAALHTDRVRAK